MDEVVIIEKALDRVCEKLYLVNRWRPKTFWRNIIHEYEREKQELRKPPGPAPIVGKIADILKGAKDDGKK